MTDAPETGAPTTRFSDRVSALLRERGMTDTALAVALGVTRHRLGHWTRGTCEPNLHYAREIAAVLEVTLDELVAHDEADYQIEQAWKRTRKSMEEWIYQSAINMRKERGQ